MSVLLKTIVLAWTTKTSLQELAENQTETQNQPQLENPETINDSKSHELKELPNHRIYLETLDKMGSEKRLAKAFELSALSRQLFMEGLKLRFPDKSDEEIMHIYLQRIAKCYNRNY